MFFLLRRVSRLSPVGCVLEMMICRRGADLPCFYCYVLRSSQLSECSVLQLRQKSRQIKELSLRLNFSLLVELEDADAFQEEDISGLGLKT